MLSYVITGIVLLIWLVLSWVAGTLVGGTPTRVWVLRGVLAVLGIVAAGVFLWFQRKIKREQAGASGPIDVAATAELDSLLQQANAKLRQSSVAANSMADLPIIYVMGEANSAKTAVVQHCGLEPDLIAGSASPSPELAPAPTPSVNIWMAKRTLFIEAGGKVSGNPQLWNRLVRATQPKISVFSKKQAPARAVLVCFDCERLCADPEQSKKVSTKLASRLREMAAALGSSFPAYVLFTKMDLMYAKAPNERTFERFVSNLTQEESGQVLGTTVARREVSEGLFREEETKRLNTAFEQMVYSLSDRRTDYLGREGKPDNLPLIYEFPRDLFKLRKQFVDTLIELTRPTQLGANAFLRGFYFTGVRPVVVSGMVMPQAQAAAAAAPAGESATRMFSMQDVQQVAAPQSPVMQSRRMPEWTFLPHLFNEVILKDRSALSASAHSSKSDVARRILMSAAAVVFLIIAALFLTSFLNNRGMQQDIIGSAQELNAVTVSPTEAPSVAQLKQLDQLRRSIVEIEGHQKDGAPLMHRFGLYSGDAIYDDAKRAYFTNFRKLLLVPAQTTMLSQMKALPATATPADDFGEAYKTLKAYLITTTNHDKSTVQFLAPALLDRWSTGRNIDAERSELAKKQFEFYADKLTAANPCPNDSDTAAVEHSRRFLKQFSGIERIYQSMLADAGRNVQAINFNRRYSGSAQVLVVSREVPGAFTKGGFKVMQDALNNPERYYGAEEWVLGEPSSINISKEELQSQLRDRYTKDYLDQWRAFLKSANVVRYTGIPDGASKLTILSGNGSPLSLLFWVAADNTKVDLPNAAKAFDSVQKVAAGAAEDHPIGGASQPYMGALIALQGSLASAAASPAGAADPNLANTVLSSAAQARNAVGQIAQGFVIDAEGKTDAQVRKLMEDPIIAAEALVRRLGPDQLNGAGKAFCDQFNGLSRKFPFNEQSQVDATVQEIAGMFQPGAGALWAFYDSSLKNVLMKQGTQFMPNPVSNMKVSPQFLAFMNRAGKFADAIYPNGSPTPNLSYTIKQSATYAIGNLSLTIDGQGLAGNGQSKKFVWTGNGTSTVHPAGTYPGGSLPFPDVTGTWAPFRFVQNAPKTSMVGNTVVAEWPLEFGRVPIKAPDGTPLIVKYELDNGQIFTKQFMAGMHCPAVGAR